MYVCMYLFSFLEVNNRVLIYSYSLHIIKLYDMVFLSKNK